MQEIWKDIPGYEGLYQASNLGRIRSLHFRGGKNQKILTPYNVLGYLRIRIFKDKKQKSIGVHRLIALTFILNPENKPEVNHIDGNKTNNIVENLEWVTASENVTHAFAVLGVCPHGGRAKKKVKNLDTNEVFNSIKEASDITGCNRTSIISCCKGKYASAKGMHWAYL